LGFLKVPINSDKSDRTCTLGIKIVCSDANSSSNLSRIRLVFTIIFTRAKTSGGLSEKNLTIPYAKDLGKSTPQGIPNIFLFISMNLKK
jgi:hypothetical protein